jgi:hypothetical protein
LGVSVTPMLTSAQKNVVRGVCDWANNNELAEDDLVQQAMKDLGLKESDEDMRNLIREEIRAYHSIPAIHTIQEKTLHTANLLDAIKAYKEPESIDEIILTAAAEAKTAMDVFKKIAVKLDERPTSSQHPGKKLFSSPKSVTLDGGNTPKFPGQKVFMTGSGGNAEVETVFSDKLPADVDVYTDKRGRKKVDSIKTSTGDTIAFIQPVPLEGTETISKEFNYNGILTGEVQSAKKGDPKEFRGGAGHVTRNYLDEAKKLADKEPQAIAGKSASTKKNIEVVGGFYFCLPKVADGEGSRPYSGGDAQVGTDSSMEVAGEDVIPKNKTISAEDAAEVRKKLQEHDAKKPTASNDIDQLSKTASNPEAEKDTEAKTLLELNGILDKIETEHKDHYADIEKLKDSPKALKTKIIDVITITQKDTNADRFAGVDFDKLAQTRFGAKLDKLVPSTREEEATKKEKTTKEESKGGDIEELEALFK